MVDRETNGPLCCQVCGYFARRVVALDVRPLRVYAGPFPAFEVDPKVFGPAVPVLEQGVTLSAGLGRPGFHRRRLLFCGCRCFSGLALARQTFLNLRAALAEAFELFAADVAQLEHAVSFVADVVALLCQLGRKLGAIHRPEVLGHFDDFVVLQCPPLAVAALRHVQNNGVGVQLGVFLSARFMAELGDNQIAGVLHHRYSVLLFAGLSPLLGQLDSLGHGLVVGLDNRGIAAYQRLERHAFRR